MRRALATILLAAGLACGVAAPAAADPLDGILAPWVARQAPDGAFPDWPGEKTGGGGGYAESVLGLALATQGARTGDAAMEEAGQRGLRWALEHPSSTVAGRQSVFEDLALATAYDTLRRRLPADLRDALRERVVGTVLARHVGSRYSNHALTETLRILTAQHAGVGLPEQDAVSATRMLTVDVPRYGLVYGQFRAGLRSAVFSDPAANPIAYQALTLAFLARSVQLLGRSATPELRATVVAMAEGSAVLMAPDGDLAYWGRSQEESWVLPFTAYGAQVAARLRPSTAPRMRLLAGRALARFDRLHVGASGGLGFSPAMTQAAPGEDERLGLDQYASLPAYTGLTAMALQWVDRGFPASGPVAPALPADVQGAAVLSNRTSRFAVIRDGKRWWAVKQRPAINRGDDGRTDFGLVAFKAERDRVWQDVLPLRPYDFRTACSRAGCAAPPPSAGPVAVTSAGDARPVGDELVRVGLTHTIDVTGRLVKPDGTTFAPLRARFAPDRAGVRMTWTVQAGVAYRLTGFFDERAGAVCRVGTTIGNRNGSLRLPPVEALGTTTGLASGSHRAITAATATVRAARTGTLAAVWSAAPVACP